MKQLKLKDDPNRTRRVSTIPMCTLEGGRIKYRESFEVRQKKMEQAKRRRAFMRSRMLRKTFEATPSLLTFDIGIAEQIRLFKLERAGKK